MGTSGNRDCFWASRSVLMLLECFWDSVRVELSHICYVGKKKLCNNKRTSRPLSPVFASFLLIKKCTDNTWTRV